MHLPDGILDVRTALLSAGTAAAGLGLALRQVRTTLPPRQMPMLGLAGAFIFAAQMLNFPVAGGTSGHLMGGPLAAVLLGPGPAVVVMTCVLIIQALVFSDGGLTALGANIFNMGIVAVGGGYLAFRVVKALAPFQEDRATVFAAAFAGWFGTVLASITCAGQLALSGTAPWHTALPAMASVHMLIGGGEGLATGLIMAAILRTRPELVAATPPINPGRNLLLYGLLLASGLALFVAPFACSWPDGLERVASRLGFARPPQPSPVPALFPGYQVSFIGSPAMATAVAGLAGTVISFVLAYLLARWLVPTMAGQDHDADTGK